MTTDKLRYVTMDYIFWTTLLVASFVGAGVGIAWLAVSYDIACQWNINLLKRFSSYPVSYTATLATLVIRFFIPNFHLPNHKLSCTTAFSFNLNRGVGRTHGETIEQEWAHISAVAMSTREMGPGARHATLDSHWSFWNWRKIVGMGKYYNPMSCVLDLLILWPGPAFKKSLRIALLYRKKHQDVLSDMESGLAPETVSTWCQVVSAWETDHSREDPFAEPEESRSFLFALSVTEYTSSQPQHLPPFASNSLKKKTAISARGNRRYTRPRHQLSCARWSY